MGQKFKVILCYIVNLRPAWDTEDPVSKKKGGRSYTEDKTIVCKTENTYTNKLKAYTKQNEKPKRVVLFSASTCSSALGYCPWEFWPPVCPVPTPCP